MTKSYDFILESQAEGHYSVANEIGCFIGGLHVEFEVFVQLKQEVLDPEGRAIKETLCRHGYSQVKSVSVSKRFLIEFDEKSKENAKDQEELATTIAREYLANPVSETFHVRRNA